MRTFNLRASFGSAVFVLVLVVCCGSTARAAETGAAAFLKKIDRSLCQSIASVKCKGKQRKATKTKATKTKVKPRKPKQSGVKVAPEVAAPVPISPPVPTPVLKPIAKPTAAAVDKRVLPVPQLKPVLKPKPEAEQPSVAVPEDKPAPTPEALPGTTRSVVVVPTPPATGGSCEAQLNALGVKFEIVGQPAGSPACIVVSPVQLASVGSGNSMIALPDRPTLNCDFAVQFAQWLRSEAAPLVKRVSGAALAKFYTGPGYQCRGRNGDFAAKLSEHAFGNAIDTERLVLANDQVLLVGKTDPGAASETLSALRQSLCGSFTTVLGPGSNAAHAEHFHFDAKRRGKSGTYRSCQ